MTNGRSSTAPPPTLFVLLGGLILGGAVVSPSTMPALAGQTASDGWQIGRDAEDLTNPLALTPAVATKGREVYRSKCQRCHGTAGRGNGPDADPEHSPGDLTDARRASRNPDGVLYYKIWNGRTQPKMPAFKTDISRDDVWSVIYHIKTFRRP